MKSTINHAKISIRMPQNNSATQRRLRQKDWIKKRRQLYGSVVEQARILQGESSDLAKYRRKYEEEFEGTFRRSHRQSLVCAIAEARLVFLADFHALQQSQKSQLRILKAIPQAQKIVLGVEFFEAKHQRHLDDFQSGKLPEAEFLRLIRWKERWGFPWENYRPLVRWALKRKVRLVGIDLRLSLRTGESLRRRDYFAADQIVKLAEEYFDHKVIVIFGDMHLAESHLPQLTLKKIAKNKSAKKMDFQNPGYVCVFQNPEEIYFKLLRKNLELKVDVVKLSSNKYCVLSVPPWVKWQNYLHFLEQSEISFDTQEEVLDPTDHVARYVDVIAEDIGFQANLNEFSIETFQQAGAWGGLKKKLSKPEQGWLQACIVGKKSFYIPKLQMGYLARLSVNHAASLASAIVYAQMSGWKEVPLQMPREFDRLIWLEAVQYFGSKFINPKRKSDTLVDVRTSLLALNQESLPAEQIEKAEKERKLRKEALRIALSQKMQELLYLADGIRPRGAIQVRNKVSYLEAAQILGGMLGERLFHGFREHKISWQHVQRILRVPIDHAQFSEVYFDFLRTVESLPQPFVSKVEKL